MYMAIAVSGLERTLAEKGGPIYLRGGRPGE
jgi:hypothetical protein